MHKISQVFLKKTHIQGGKTHRLECVRKIGEVFFIDDSISTSFSSTINSLSVVKGNIALILCGIDKGSDLDEFLKNINQKSDFIVVFGEIKNRLIIRAKTLKVQNIISACSFKEAVKLAYKKVEPKGKVLFSPACASFDMFKDANQRGKVFVKIVENLEVELNNIKNENHRSKGKKE